MRRILAAVALALLPHESAFAHEVDEYVQATLISLETDRLDVQLRLVPGAAVFSKVFAGIDTNADGAVSRAEQAAYARHVVADLTLAMNGQRVVPQIVSVDFPSVDLMKEGLGEIHIALRVPVLARSAKQKLVFQNHHQSAISAYLVNTLAPREGSVKILRQRRSNDQAHYELEYERLATSSLSPSS